MTAGRGIVHSEMPYFDDPNPETAVRAEGMQLWVDLPESQKFCEPSYQEKKAAEYVPSFTSLVFGHAP